jgi:hypothetical protein
MIDIIVQAAGAALLVLVMLNLLALAAIKLMHVASARTAQHARPIPPIAVPTATATATPSAQAGRPPFVSIHVPTHDEPPRIVAATLDSLARLRGVPFEVIVLDNNTPDPATWQPLQRAAEALGPNFRFFHFRNMPGAKAGALNIALGMTDERATHVAVVDADYQVQPDFLVRALGALGATGADYVQFPQAYRGTERARGVAAELRDFFDTHARAGHVERCVLPTGTLSVFSVDALHEVGAWSPQTVTEDAELGTRLVAAGRRGIYLDEIAGEGVLPTDFAGLRMQRERWIAGNAQTLRQLLARRRRGVRLPVIAMAAQLTAWVTSWTLPAIALVLAAWGPSQAVYDQAGLVAAVTVLLSLGVVAQRLFITTGGRPLGEVRDMLAVKLALAWTSSTAWLAGFSGRPIRFARTPKWLSLGASDMALGQLAICGVMAACVLPLAVMGHWLQALAAACMAMSWPAALWVDLSLRASARQRDAAEGSSPVPVEGIVDPQAHGGGARSAA